MMFSRKKEEKRSSAGRNGSGGLSKYGLFDIPNLDTDNFGGIDDSVDDNDEDLEAELLALTSGGVPTKPKRSRAPAAKTHLDTLVAESLRDIPSDDDVSVDENDPALLSELSGIIGSESDENIPDSVNQNETKEEKKSGNCLLDTLQERLSMYQEAEKNAKLAGETSRARRFTRGIKTLNDMIKQASAGRVINEEDIPPPVLVSAAKKPTDTVKGESTKEPGSKQLPITEEKGSAVPSRPAPPPPVTPKILENEMADNNENVVQPSSDSDSMFIAPIGDETESEVSSFTPDQSVINSITTRRDEYKAAALKAKREGNNEQAIKFVRIVKQFEPVIAAAQAGQPVDLNTLPPSPNTLEGIDVKAQPRDQPRTSSEVQQSDAVRAVGEAAEMIAAAAEAAQGESSINEESLFNAPAAPTTVLEALEQRLAKYRSTEQAAKEEGNSGKVRRMGRIVKQYESAIKMHKAGKPFPVDELPTPPGFAPIPVEGSQQPQTPPSVPSENTVCIVPASPATNEVKDESPDTAPATPTPSCSIPKPNVRKSPQSRQEKQLALLVARQKKFKEAALEAKRKGEVNQAKEYLRLAKGFDPLIEASNNGLPVDITSLPVPPENKVILESDFDIVSVEDCIPGSDAEIYEKLEEDLLKQTKMCMNTRDHFKAVGDVASANRFEQLAVHSKKDLDAVKYAHKRNDPIPKFHYETRTFNIVQCCTELGDNDLELTIVQGINYNVSNPKDVDTYVKFEFPYPTEAPVRDRTAVVKDTNNPQYNQTFTLAIQRNVRACQRVFKRHAIKLEVWSRGSFLHNICCICCYMRSNPDNKPKCLRSFFRGDSLIGTATVKLMPLETKCVIHDAFDLMDGRKAVGGKVEVKVRLRNPIHTKQVEPVQEKWLVIDQYQ